MSHQDLARVQIELTIEDQRTTLSDTLKTIDVLDPSERLNWSLHLLHAKVAGLRASIAYLESILNDNQPK